MVEASLHDEKGRMAALHRYDILDTEPEAPFDKIVALVRTVLAVPIATVTLVDRDRQWFKASLGTGIRQSPRDLTFCTHTIQGREPLIVPDAQADPRFADFPMVTGEPFMRSYVGVLLTTPDGYNIGTLCAIDVKTRVFSDAQIAILTNFASLIMDEMELRQIAQRDQLTGALTRRGFIEHADKELARFHRYGRPSALVMIDVDHFKSVNDAHGHPGGDAVLRGLASVCAGEMRPNDVLGRIGGEEFAMLLPETDMPEALQAAERFRLLIETSPFTLANGSVLHVTASLGVAAVTADITHTDQWLAAADAPLYAAKRGGRNRCCAVTSTTSIAA